MARLTLKNGQTEAGRPIILGTLAPLTQTSPEAWWEEAAKTLGLTVLDLKEQIRIADEIMDEILAEERRERDSQGPTEASSP